MKKIDPKEIRDNAMQLIGHDWMLVTAGTPEHFNMMTASWGGLGFMWKKPVAFVVIRPQRHTFGFIEAGEEFTLSFFSHEYHKALTVCGTTSGRDTDKVAASGLTPYATENGNVSLRKRAWCWNAASFMRRLSIRKPFWTRPLYRSGTPRGISTRCTSWRF